MKLSPLIRLRPAAARGRTDLGWLDSRHSFSFGNYEDPAHRGFHALRVINDDRVAPLGGFPSHPHRDMEIFSYVLEGRLEHADSLGNARVLEPGEVQLMRAGRGVVHSERNPSETEAVRFLQVWISPSSRGLQPVYTEWQGHSGIATKALAISPDGREGSARIAQDVCVYRIRLGPGEWVLHEVVTGRALWVQVAGGRGNCNAVEIEDGDGISCEGEGCIRIASETGLEALLFDLRAD